MKKTYLKNLIILFLILFFVVSPLNTISYAASTPIGGGSALTVGACDSVLKSYEANAKINFWSIDIGATISNAITAGVLDLFSKLIGVSATTALKCESVILGAIGGLGGEEGNPNKLGFKNTPSCTGADETECRVLLNSQNLNQTGYNYQGESIGVLAIQNSLWGISNQIENVNRRDPVVLNLAYYWNDQIAHIPFVNKALAASTYTDLPILAATLSLWKATRNAALGLISVVLLYTGILIIMRKKVSSQLVVSVQYAIPKILVGLVLILFSFPIGAAITSISFGLFRGSALIVQQAALGRTISTNNFTGAALAALIVASLKNGLGGLAYLVLTVVIILVVIVLRMVVGFKIILIYLKMIMSTLTAPFEFALGTLPGNDDTMKDWFVRMAKYGFTIFAMGLVEPVVIIMAIKLLLIYSGIDPSSGPVYTNLETAGMGTIMAIVMPLIIIIFGFSLAIGMEGTVDAMFGGKSKKR